MTEARNPDAQAESPEVAHGELVTPDQLSAPVGPDLDVHYESLKAYEDARLPATSKIVVQNRTAPPNVIVDMVEQRTGGKRFDRLEDVMTQDEMKAIFDGYQKVAGYQPVSQNSSSSSGRREAP